MSDLRWYVKKAARRAVATGATLPGLGVRATSPDRPAIRALTYHRFGPQERDPFSVTPAAFEEQMAWLASEGLATSLQAVLGPSFTLIESRGHAHRTPMGATQQFQFSRFRRLD